MLKCNGWTKYEHEARQVTEIYISGCEHCGGQCGDTGEALALCPECLCDLESDKAMIGRYEARVK